MDKVAMYKDYIEKTAGVKFKDLKKNEVKLTPEERKQVMESKAVWGSSPAVWKSVDKDGKATYVTNTHRAFNTAPTLKGAIGRFHNFIKSTASENVDDSIEKIAQERIMYHASPVQGIKKFRRSEDTSGNNKGKVIFASKDPGFSAAFGIKWNDGIARLNVETKNTQVPTEDNYVGSTLKYTDKVNIEAPCSMYKIKGDFKPLRYGGDVEHITNKDVEIISEEKFKSFKDMAKAYGLNLTPISEQYILNKLKGKKSSNFEKTAEQKIPELEEAFSDPIEKKVAYMIATSHEYKKPNINAALSFVKNYKWELTTEKVKNLQGIEKPVNEEKVADMAKNMKHVEPFIVVNQLHGIRPQTPGKKILIDGHHRKKACEAQNREEVPIYKGTYTGKAELSKNELKTAYDIVNEAYEKHAGLSDHFGLPDISSLPPQAQQSIKTKFNGFKTVADFGKKMIGNAITPDGISDHVADQAFNGIKDSVNIVKNVGIKNAFKMAIPKLAAEDIINEMYEEKIAAQKKDKSQTHVNKIMKSGERQTMLHITYTDKKGDTTGRLVEPYKLSGDSFWGFDPAKESIRRFKVGQINGTRMTKVKFDPRWPIETGGYTLPKTEEPSGQLHLTDIVKK